jgi:hypothetical protein
MTSKEPSDSRTIMNFLALSLLVHLAFAVPLDFFKPFELGTAVRLNPTIMVDLRGPAAAAPVKQPPPMPPVADSREESSASQAAEEQPAATPSVVPGPVAAPAAPIRVQEPPTPSPVRVPSEPADARIAEKSPKTADLPPTNVPVIAPPLRKVSEFLANDWEKLSYRISMSGIPVGSAELEAKQEKGEIRISLHIQSNAAISQLYPVDDNIETRHIGGNFILGRIRQREGSYRGDRGFTLFLRDKSVFWIDRLKNTTLTEPLPNSSVVDILSGLYFYRNLSLEVGTSVVLQLFDSNRYSPTTVVVLRKEHLTLPGMRGVDTLVVHPQLKTEGLFKRTGEILVWLTDDEKKVPVKVETRIVLGKVTAELVSAETHKAVAPKVPARVDTDRQVQLKE